MKIVREVEKRARERLVTRACESRLCPRSAVANGVAAAGGASPSPPPPPPVGPSLSPSLGSKAQAWLRGSPMVGAEGEVCQGGAQGCQWARSGWSGPPAPGVRKGPGGALRHSGGEEGKLRWCRLLAWASSLLPSQVSPRLDKLLTH